MELIEEKMKFYRQELTKFSTKLLRFKANSFVLSKNLVSGIKHA